MKFGKYKISSFVKSCEKVLLGGNTEATAALKLTFVLNIKVHEQKINVRGGYSPLVKSVSPNKSGNSFKVQTFISICRCIYGIRRF